MAFSVTREDVDIEAAVAAGILGEDQALALRNVEASQAGISAASAERVEIASEGRRPTRRKFEFAPRRTRIFGRLAESSGEAGTTLPG